MSRDKPPCSDFSSCSFPLKRHILSTTGEGSKGKKQGVVAGVAPWIIFLVFGAVIGSLVDRGGLFCLFLWWEETWYASLYDLGYVFGLLQRTTL
jgi:hypothetical protein